eukprot:CAMPEP_0179128690 /NCGR_PEP_ID=MMETSP0796-20121207/61028_1 /TAXON_ID=73915 /ORGANISM="Pyrodinium bahamense, Strain pbaha01" /LENGTH=253 /DNA_ID=CAMNT_0020827545 /DNA_START=1 /DNA_END=762 /DNA_ORIENTATION=+
MPVAMGGASPCFCEVIPEAVEAAKFQAQLEALQQQCAAQEANITNLKRILQKERSRRLGATFTHGLSDASTDRESFDEWDAPPVFPKPKQSMPPLELQEQQRQDSQQWKQLQQQQWRRQHQQQQQQHYDLEHRRDPCRSLCRRLLCWIRGASIDAGEGGAVQPLDEARPKATEEECREATRSTPSERRRGREPPPDQLAKRAAEASPEDDHFLRDFLEMHGAAVLGGELGVKPFEAQRAHSTKIREEFWLVVD